MKVIINPYHKSVTIDGVEVVQKFINFPDALNHLASISCDYDRDSQTITDVQDVHRYVSHAIEKQYYYKHLPEFVDWFYAEQQAQLDNAISVEQQIVAANTAAQNAATSAEKAKLEAEEAKKTNQNTQQAVDNAVAKLTQAGSTLPVKSDGTDVARTLGERFADVINVKDFGAVGDGETDDTVAIQEAVTKGGTVFFPAGRYIVSAPIVRENSGLVIQGSGIDVTVIEPSEAFEGSSIFIFGGKYKHIYCTQISVRDVKLDLAGRVDCGIELYGVRDGSTFENVYIWHIRKYGILTGWTNTGVEGAVDHTMCEGLLFSNCHVLGMSDIGETEGAEFFSLSGLYESTFINCKALGYSAHTFKNTSGFVIGTLHTKGMVNYDCRGVRLYNCSTGGFIGENNIGVWFAQAQDCSATHHTLETITGPAIAMGQRVKSENERDSRGPAYCIVDSPRLFNPADREDVNNPCFKFFGDARQDSVINVPYVNGHGDIAQFLDYVVDCSVDIFTALYTPDDFLEKINFSAPSNTNIVYARTGALSTRIRSRFTGTQFDSDRYTNGEIREHSQYYTRIKMAQPWHFCTQDASDTILEIQKTTSGSIVAGIRIRPATDNAIDFGSAYGRWANVYAGTDTINTSDAREKTSVTAPNEALMRAWGKVNFKAFQFMDAIEKKGENARIHFGIIAQQVQEAFTSEGLDASRYALFCYDKWDNEYEDVEVIDVEATYDGNGNELTPQISHTEKKLVTPAGDRYGIRYSEALALECAYQRWKLEKLEEKLAKLEV